MSMSTKYLLKDREETLVEKMTRNKGINLTDVTHGAKQAIFNEGETFGY